MVRGRANPLRLEPWTTPVWHGPLSTARPAPLESHRTCKEGPDYPSTDWPRKQTIRPTRGVSPQEL